jgi:hypothetical protein
MTSDKRSKRAGNSSQEPGDLGKALALLIQWGREARAQEATLKAHEADGDTVKDTDVSEEKNNEQQE